MATFTNQTKNTTTFSNIVAHGKATILRDIENMTFNDAPFLNDTEAIKDKTFSELVDTSWANQTKNTTTFSNQTKN